MGGARSCAWVAWRAHALEPSPTQATPARRRAAAAGLGGPPARAPPGGGGEGRVQSRVATQLPASALVGLGADQSSKVVGLRLRRLLVADDGLLARQRVLRERATWLSTATSKVCPLSVVWPSYLFCVPSTLVNVTAWLAMNSSSVAGAVVSAGCAGADCATDTPQCECRS